MGRKQKDYSRGKIYLIRNTVNELLYVGSTCQTVSQRMTQHRSDAKKIKKQNYLIYKAMRELGADKFYIEWHSDFPCERGEQLTKREGEVMRELGTLKNGYNKIQAGRSAAEWYKDNAESVKEKVAVYKKNNAAAIKAKRAENKIINAAVIKAQYAAQYLKKIEKAALTTNP